MTAQATKSEHSTRGSVRGILILGSLALLVVGGAWLYRQRGQAGPSDQARPPRVLSLEEICEWVSVADPYVGTGNVATYEDQLEAARAHPAKTAVLGEALEGLGETYLRHGKNDEAVALLNEALELALSEGRPLDVVQRVRRNLGVAWMRVGETGHCIAMHNPESCLFPIQAGGVWSNPAGAIQAAALFSEFLEHEPDDLGVRWLLNVAHQVAGTHPDGVPPEFLIPLSTFEAETRIGRFREIAGEIGVDTLNLAGGAILDDLDGDGWLDLFTSTQSFCETVRYFHNSGDGTFEDWTTRAGLGDQLGGFNCEQADVDGDGRLDVLVLRGGWQGRKFGRQRNSLLLQQADGTFKDVTKAAGLAEVAFPTQVGAFADYDLDGDVDLFIGNEYMPCQLFENDGTGRFVDRAREAGVIGESNCAVKGANWGDFDNDGDPDLYVSNYGKPNRLYRNEGGGRFVEVAEQLGVQADDSDLERRAGDEQVAETGRTSILAKDFTRESTQNQTFAAWFWDFDNDGWLDLFVTGFGGGLADVAGSYLGEPVATRRHLRVYRNDGRGGFENVSAELGVDDVHLPMGANFGDIDNDGWVDFYLGTGRPGFEYLVPNALYLNDRGEGFIDVTAQAGVGHLQKGHGVALGDIDNDGDLDIFAQMGGFYFADAFRDALFENPGNDNRWLTVQLRGTESNGFGIGARVRAVVETPAGERTIHAVCGSGASFGASSLQQELGLGDATRIVRVEIDWPGGDTQVVEGLELDTIVRVTEGPGGKGAFEVQDLAVLELGS